MADLNSFPDDLPIILYYRIGETVRTALPRRPVNYKGSSGATDAHDCCPRIPYGCTGWQMAGDTEWRPLNTMPVEWMPFVNRLRPGPMDPRPALARKE